MATKHVNVTVTDTKGCTVEINGDVNYSVIPPKFNGFKGTIKLSGGAGCPKGQLTFRTKGKEGVGRGLAVAFDTNAITKVSKITWRGDNDVITALNGRTINKTLCNVIRIVPFAEIGSTRKRTG